MSTRCSGPSWPTPFVRSGTVSDGPTRATWSRPARATAPCSVRCSKTSTTCPIRAIAVERSAGARAILSTIDGVTVLDRMPADGAGIVVAHELLDNLAFRRVRGTEDGPREVRVTVADDASSRS